MLAYYLGAHESHEFGGEVYLGYWVKTNFWPFIFVLPFMLWIIRVVFNRMAPINTREMTVVPPIIQLIRDLPAQKQAYQEMCHYLTSPILIGAVFAVALMIQVIDMRELMGVYFSGGDVRTGEADWSVMYTAGIMTRWENFTFVLFAYVVQFLVIWIQCLVLFFLLGHNLFFLNRIYQRSRVSKEAEQSFIVIDLDDVNQCFGFRKANDAFNSQVVLLILYGVVALLSRYNNVYIEGASLQFGDVLQWIVSIFWVLTFVIVTLPAWVKLLPRFSSQHKSTEISITDYMKEFILPGEWTYGDEPSTKVTNQLAAKFARNSFWPTGNNRASQLFFFCGWVFLIILLPLQTEDMGLLVLILALLGGIAYVFRSLLIFSLNIFLSFIDERLSKPNPEILDQIDTSPVKLKKKVFISYRREDASAYAKLVQQSLLPYMEADNVFIDRVGIHDGDDFVDTITEAVLSCDVLLVGGNQMPKLDDVPESLEPLLRRHARELSDSRWEYDLSELVNAISEKSET